MEVSSIVSQIDLEIARLQQARALLSGETVRATKKAAASGPNKPTSTTKKKKKRNLTPEGRKRIAEAVKRRWANQKKAAGNK
jgi:hypothetical protein